MSQRSPITRKEDKLEPSLTDVEPTNTATWPSLRGNKQIEDAAIAWVIDAERHSGRDAVDTRYRGAPGDVSSPPRVIEVKAFGTSNRGFGLWLETRQVEEARSNDNFFLYVVENVRQGNPAEFRLKVLDCQHVRHLLMRAKLRSYYEVPWPTKDYDSTSGI